MTRLRHQLVDDDVLITAVVSGRPMGLHVTQTEAKRFAWALLSDLDPSGTEDAPESETAFRQPYASGQKVAMLSFLASRDADTRAIAAHIGRALGHASSVMSQAKVRGLVEIMDAPEARLSAVWRITDSGRAWLRRRLERAA